MATSTRLAKIIDRSQPGSKRRKPARQLSFPSAGAYRQTLRQVATFLFALERLPYVTEGVAIDLAKVERHDFGSSYVSVELTEYAFRLSQDGSEYIPGVGSDSYSSDNFELEAGGFRNGETEDFREWLEAFRCARGTYSVVNDGDDNIDLSEEGRDDGWERLAKYWTGRP